MRSRWNLPVLAGFGFVCVVAMALVVANLGVRYPWSHPFTLTADFRNGAGILASDEVFMNGAKVGRITSVDAAGNKAVVTMYVDDARVLPLYRDATAQVRIKNLLGEDYVELTPGHPAAGRLADGGAIPESQTITPVQIDEVLAVLDPGTRDRLRQLINGAGDALANRGTDLNGQARSVNNLLTSLNGPASVLAARQQQLEAVVLELQRLYDTLAAQRDQVREGFATWNDVMGQLAAQETSIAGTLQQADTLLSSLDTLVSGEVPNLQAVLDRLAPALTHTNTFLDQSNTILNGILPYRRSIHDVFPDLGTSFQDVDPLTGQHVWSVYGVNCSSTCTGGNQVSAAGGPSSGTGVWSQLASAGGAG